MNIPKVEVTLRIPGNWSSPRDFIAAIPSNCRVTPESLILADGTAIELNLRDADDQFVSVFAVACRVMPTEAEKQAIETYTVQVCLTGAGGSDEQAAVLMRAAAVILRAGGSGVFVDNSGLAFGATQWHEITDADCSDARSYAYVNIIRGKTEVYTVGLHILGLPDLLMRLQDIDEEGEAIIEVIQYLCSRSAEVADGHVIADIYGPRFIATAVKDEKTQSPSPLFNPWGRLRLDAVSSNPELN